jgi:HlyD family secretion protein
LRRAVVIVLMLVILFIVILSIVGKKEPEELLFISGSGTIEVTEIEIGSKNSGRVEKLWVDEGEEVDSGKVLVELDHKELDAQLAQTKASVNVAKTRVDQAKSEWENVGINLKRIRELYKAGSVTKKELDDLETKYKLASDQYKLVSHQYEQSKAAVELIKAQLENTIIKSPIKGVVLEKNTNPGEVVFPGISLLTLADLSTVWLKIYIKEDQLGWVKLGQKAEVKVDSYPEKTFRGKVVHISDKAEFTPKDIQTKEERVKLVFGVKISLENPEQELKPGMPADAQISIE